MSKIMTNEEMREIFWCLEEAGMNPQLCDTPIPYYEATVQAGCPTDPGDTSPAGMVWMPSELVESSMLMLKVRGESMRDAGFSSGDRIVVEYDTRIEDGDIVVATFGNESTVKTYMTDEQGNRWLVPHNPSFRPIRLTEEMGNIRMGKVVQLIKQNPRMRFSEIMQLIKAEREGVEEKKEPVTMQRAEEVVRSMGNEVAQARQWFAVFRAVVDAGVLRADEYDAFVRMVAEVLPEHRHLPAAPELRRMAVQSFRKSVDRWSAYDAPVSGYRFEAYLRIAEETARRLRE